jgi:DNA polymerase IV
MQPAGLRKILHVDMDAFYASVEQRDNSELRGRPVAVGGRSNRGVVTAASYEARPFGVRSAMPMARARRMCPDLVVVPPRFDAYRDASRAIRAVFARYTDLVEPLSLDEAYLDVTEAKLGPPSATLIAQAIRNEVRAETGLPCSAGVSFGKFLAKTASGLAKPDGLRVITPAEAPALIDALAVEAFHGVGPATARRLRARGIASGADLKAWSETDLRAAFGKTGGWLYRVAHCLDDRPVRPDRVRKSVGVERTFSEDVEGEELLRARLAPIAEELARRLAKHELSGHTLTLKIKSADFEITSRSETVARPLADEDEILRLGCTLLARPDVPPYPVRLLGLTVSSLLSSADEPGRQLILPFPDLAGASMVSLPDHT